MPCIWKHLNNNIGIYVDSFLNQVNLPMAQSSPKNLFFSIITLCLSLALTFGAIEVVLRIKNSTQDVYDIEMWRYSKDLKRASLNPVLGHEHIPSSQAILQKTSIRINELGLRGGPVAPLLPGGRRILFLGSSITLGWGVEEKNIMTTLLEQRFYQSGEKVQVLNAGIGNYNTVRYVERFFANLKELKPTDIVVHYFINDAEKLQAGGGNFLLRNSQLAVTLWTVANRVIGLNGEGTLVDHYRRVYEEGATGYLEMKSALSRLSAYAKEKGIRVIFAMTPDIHNLDDYKLSFIHERMKNIASELGYSYVDFLPTMKGIDSKSIWAMPGDPHPNALGHKIMAEALYRTLSNGN